MKNVSMILNVVLIAALIYAGCNPNQGEKKIDPATQAQQNDPDQNDCNIRCLDFSNDHDMTIIEGDILKTMARDYRNSNTNRVNNSPDANSVWFPLKDLKRFIWNIERAACENNCSSDSLNLGIRLYYARYPQTGSNAPPPFTDLPSDYQGMHTLFMVPTFDVSGSSNHHNDFYLDKPFANCEPVRIPIDAPTDPVVVFLPDGKNHGTLCPPACDGAAFAQ